jgi:magnesium chelatase family protein
MVGGGARLRPGEISLAHRGVLFLDELPEFERDTLEALRQPLEDRLISVARAKETADYPADFILVGTANPCPCGYYGTADDNAGSVCRCQPYEIIRYRHKLSGPILDRIDLCCNVHEVQHDKLLAQRASAAADNAVRQRILQARKLQARRYGKTNRLNAGMTNRDIKAFAGLQPDARSLLNSAATRLKISARAYMRTIKVARTIADLETVASITPAHISEALAYRTPKHKD